MPFFANIDNVPSSCQQPIATRQLSIRAAPPLSITNLTHTAHFAFGYNMGPFMATISVFCIEFLRPIIVYLLFDTNSKKLYYK
jgi:hypothetical protein